MSDALVEVRNIRKYFTVGGGFFSGGQARLKAVDGVNLAVWPGETLGLVGESGCGKTTLGRLILLLDRPTEGEVFIEGKNAAQFTPEALRQLRRRMQVIFQDPYSSLDPRKTVGYIIEEPLIIHGLGDRPARRERVRELMEVVGLRPEQARRHPHEFSGGQRQRVGIARALALNPRLVVCDEPVSALDVSIQSQVLNLLKELQEKFSLTYLFIAHDLSVVAYMSDRVAVMYLGRVVELSGSDDLYAQPLHPYTQALLSASPVPDPTAPRDKIILAGDLPSPITPPAGCHFHTRCPRAQEMCRTEPAPSLNEVGPGRWVRCWMV